MIADAFINTIYAFVYVISLAVSSFGTVSENNAITESITAIKSYYISLNDIYPIDVILAIVAFELAFEGTVFLYKMLRWAYQKVPGIT